MPVSWYDDWKLNPPEPKVYTKCCKCGGEIYVDSEYIVCADGTELCSDDCFDAYAKEILQPTHKTGRSGGI